MIARLFHLHGEWTLYLNNIFLIFIYIIDYSHVYLGLQTYNPIID